MGSLEVSVEAGKKVGKADQAERRPCIRDAENHLIEVIVGTTTTTYEYDYLGRRVSKKVGTASQVQYLYDGWSLIADYTGTILERTYTWGLDFSGSMQGAGGVGGLLLVNDQTAIYYPAYDGNGNVSEYLDSSGPIDNDGSRKRDTSISLAHEIGHAIDDHDGERLPDLPTPPTRVGFPNKQEEIAVDFENQVRNGRWPKDKGRQRGVYHEGFDEDYLLKHKGDWVYE